MTKQIACLLAALLITLATGLTVRPTRAAQAGQPAQPSAEITNLIQRDYPGATNIQVVRSHEENGVQVSRVRFTTKDGRPGFARVTSNGLVLASGVAEPVDQIPLPVRRTIDDLFRQRPDQVEAATRNLIVVNITSHAGRRDELVLDPLGRLVDVIPGSEERRHQGERVAGNERREVADAAVKHVGGGTAGNVYRDLDHPGSDLVEVTDAKGQHVTVSITPQGRVLATQTALDPAKLPQPVRNTVTGVFRPNKIDDAAERQVIFYQLSQPGPDGQQLTLQIRPNGDVMQVLHGSEAGTPGAAAEPQQAAERQHEGNR